MKIGILGTGSIASAVVDGLAGQGHAIVVSRRSEARSAELAARHAEVSVAENPEVVAHADVVILGLMPDVARDILADLPFRADQVVISLIADLPLDAVAGLVAPARAEALVLPFPSVARGGSPLLVLGDATTTEALLGDRNTLYLLRDTAEAAAYLAAQAVLSPAVALVAKAADWLAPHAADPTAGEAFLRHLVGQSLRDGPTDATLAALDTPGGYNQRLRQHMETVGTGDHLLAGLDSLHRPD